MGLSTFTSPRYYCMNKQQLDGMMKRDFYLAIPTTPTEGHVGI
jgi:hypothetical protein